MSLIDRHALLKKVYEHPQERERMTDGEWCRKCIYEAPEVEAEPVRRGRWIQTTLKGYYECSACGYEHTSNPDQRFCSYCGAKMYQTGGTISKERFAEIMRGDDMAKIELGISDVVAGALEKIRNDGYTVRRWIPCNEMLPESVGNKVLVFCTGEDVNDYVGFGHYENFKHIETWYNLETGLPFADWGLTVTHWMPRPEPPRPEPPEKEDADDA